MNKSIAQRARHREMNASLRGRVPRSDDDPAIGQDVLPQTTVEHQLIAGSLRHLRRRSQFVKEQDAFPTGGKELGWCPLGLEGGDAGQAAQIDRIELPCANIAELALCVVRNLEHDLRFSYAAWSPDVQGHAFADERKKRFIEHGGFHWIVLEGRGSSRSEE